MRCQILDISETGALLVPLDGLLCPQEFVLRPDFDQPRPCAVVWRKGTRLGVRFGTALLSDAAHAPGRDAYQMSRREAGFHSSAERYRALALRARNSAEFASDPDQRAELLVEARKHEDLAIRIESMRGKAAFRPLR